MPRPFILGADVGVDALHGFHRLFREHDANGVAQQVPAQVADPVAAIPVLYLRQDAFAHASKPQQAPRGASEPYRPLAPRGLGEGEADFLHHVERVERTFDLAQFGPTILPASPFAWCYDSK